MYATFLYTIHDERNKQALIFDKEWSPPVLIKATFWEKYAYVSFDETSSFEEYEEYDHMFEHEYKYNKRMGRYESFKNRIVDTSCEWDYFIKLIDFDRH